MLFWIVVFFGSGTICTNDLKRLFTCEWRTYCKAFDGYPMPLGHVCGRAIARYGSSKRSTFDRVCLHTFVTMVLDREIEYHWLQLWKAIIGLLDFLGGKLDELTSTVGIEELLQEVMLSVFRPLAVAHCSYSPSSCWILHLQKSKLSSRHQGLSTNSL